MLRSAQDFEKCSIGATDGYHVHVKDIYFDDHAWAISFLVVNTSIGRLGHKVLIAPQWIDRLQWSDQFVAADLSRESVRAAPAYDPSADLDRQRETDLYTHYGSFTYWQPNATLKHEI